MEKLKSNGILVLANSVIHLNNPLAEYGRGDCPVAPNKYSGYIHDDIISLFVPKIESVSPVVRDVSDWIAISASVDGPVSAGALDAIGEYNARGSKDLEALEGFEEIGTRVDNKPYLSRLAIHAKFTEKKYAIYSFTIKTETLSYMVIAKTGEQAEKMRLLLIDAIEACLKGLGWDGYEALKEVT